jgi:REP element-mobilizing transposase RayT
VLDSVDWARPSLYYPVHGTSKKYASRLQINVSLCVDTQISTQSYFVETIGNATEDTIRKYVQDQLIELDRKEKYGSQLGLF